ncbi:MAG TPA: hypothetical protein PLI02_02630, partial [Candidatus Pacearchaeota archaeon]|nr:hypothetical protein [Candidatus Pacearchaeota archaeon]
LKFRETSTRPPLTSPFAMILLIGIENKKFEVKQYNKKIKKKKKKQKREKRKNKNREIIKY